MELKEWFHRDQIRSFLILIKCDLLLLFLLDNFCFNIGAINIPQDAGTPVSSDPATYSASSFLYL